VVATAPRPTTITPSLPFAGATLLLDALGLPALFFFVAMDLSFPSLVSIVEALQQDGD
jgi:hypothetical protein